MRTIPNETLNKIRSLAKELQTAVNEADCKLLAQIDDMWLATLKLVPNEVAMRYSPKSPDIAPIDPADSDIAPIDPADVPSINELDVTVFDSNVKQLYNNGEAADNVC